MEWLSRERETERQRDRESNSDRQNIKNPDNFPISPFVLGPLLLQKTTGKQHKGREGLTLFQDVLLFLHALPTSVTGTCQMWASTATNGCVSTKSCSQPTWNHSSVVSTHPASWSGAPFNVKPTWLWKSNSLMVSGGCTAFFSSSAFLFFFFFCCCFLFMGLIGQ